MSLTCNGCVEYKEESEVITLKCFHTFCWKCIEDYLLRNINKKIKCPLKSCNREIKDAEIRQVLSPEDIVKYDDFCVNQENVHCCILPECGFRYYCKEKNLQFDCYECSMYNCLNCKKAHKGMTCMEKKSRQGESRKTVCEREMKRARKVITMKQAQNYRESIIQGEASILAPNYKIFICGLCDQVVGKMAGIILRQCFHKICRECLRGHVQNSQNTPVICPFLPCNFTLQDRECREILSEDDRNIYEIKSLAHAARQLQVVERCRQINCQYFLEVDKNVKKWTCPLCSSINCVECNAIHQGSCNNYINSKVLTEDEIKIEAMIKEKKLMRCPSCRILLDKISGCNWIKCSSCQTELCWIKQTYRWGPKGRGDTSEGCKCGVNGKMCDPECGGCIPHDQLPCLIM